MKSSTNKFFLPFMIALAATLGFMSGSAYAHPEGKVEICHLPPGNPENVQNIEIGISALEAHLAHGDLLGECIGEHAEADDDEVVAVTPPLTSPPAKVYSMRSIYGQ